MTFSIAGKETIRMIKITDQSKITKQGVAATMKDIVADEEVHAVLEERRRPARSADC